MLLQPVKLCWYITMTPMKHKILTFLVLNGISINTCASWISEGFTNSVGKFGSPNVRLIYPSAGMNRYKLGIRWIKSNAYKQTQIDYICIAIFCCTVGSLWLSDAVTEDGLNDCGFALSFTSVNLKIPNVVKLNSSMGSTYNLNICPGLTLNYKSRFMCVQVMWSTYILFLKCYLACSCLYVILLISVQDIFR